MKGLIACSMCGHDFTHEEGKACSGGCPMARGCGMVTCPSCGYEFPPESKLVSLLSLIFKGRREPPRTEHAATEPRPLRPGAAS